ncbi:MAG: glycosyltransferase [Giesbergeria sp.]
MFDGDTIVHGLDLVVFLGNWTLNFIGEPTTVMFRRRQMMPYADALASINGWSCIWLGDLAMHVNLLRAGHLVMLDQLFSQFRIWGEQESQKARDDPSIGAPDQARFKEAIRSLGMSPESSKGTVRMAALGRPDAWEHVALMERLDRLIRGEPAIDPLLSWSSLRIPRKSEGVLIEQRLAKSSGGPRIIVFVRDIEGNTDALLRTVASLDFGNGLYANVRMVVLTTASVPRTKPSDKLHMVPISREGWPDGLNEQLVEADCDWFVLADAGDEFSRAGLLMAALRILEQPELRALWCDELRRLPSGSLGAAFRPDFNLDLLLSLPSAMARHVLFHRDSVIGLKGLNPHAREACELDLILRMVDAGGFAGFGHLAEVLLTTEAPVLKDVTEEREAIEHHLQQRGYEAASVTCMLPGRYRLHYGHASQPLVSIIIPTKDQFPVLQRCVESLLEKTSYPRFEVLIVDNNSTEPDAVQWLDGVAGMNSEQVRVLRYPHAFNYSAINNAAAVEARGDYLVLLNNDTAVLQAEWLDNMLNHAQRPEVGIVGAKLLYPNGTVQHAGVILGLRGPAGHVFPHAPLNAAGYMHRLEVDQNYSAVTAACLMVRKSVYEELGGLDEQAFQVSYNDVDFCLRVRQAGYLVVWTPHAVLMHEESLSQTRVDTASHAARAERFQREQQTMYERWLPLLARDPAYNKNLMLTSDGFELEPNSSRTWRPLSWKPVPVALVLPADRGGCGYYRMIKPFEAMRASSLLDGMLSADFFSPSELERYDADAIVFQRQLSEEQLENMRSVRQFARAFKVYELDDYLPNLPIKSAHKQDFAKDAIKQLRRGLACVDRFVVSTDMLAESFAGLHPDIRVVKNRLPCEWWAELSAARCSGQRPRVGWAGGMGHTGDLELIADVVQALATEVEWVFMGMCPERIRPFVHEVHAGVPIDAYPKALAALNLDLALAPLEHNLFNECKSNLRLLEYGACGVPVVCSDLACYRGDLPVTRVKNRFRDWVEAIRMHTTDLDAAGQAGDALKESVMRDWMLEGRHLQDWRSAWTGS